MTSPVPHPATTLVVGARAPEALFAFLSPDPAPQRLLVLAPGEELGPWLDFWQPLLDHPAPLHLEDGLHRLQAGRWQITLCVAASPPTLADWAAQCSAQASRVWLAPGIGPWAGPQARTLARLCCREARLTSSEAPSPDQQQAWQQAGFSWDSGCHAVYAPRWPVAAPRGPLQRSAIVVGAGLAGSAVCASLVRRGWEVVLLEAASGPAQGASGLPVGMMSAHITAQETLLSQLARPGLALHQRELQRLLPEGQGWQATQVTNLRPSSGDESSQPRTLAATLVRPAALVQAWLAQARATGRLQEQKAQPVHRLSPVDGGSGGWEAWSADGRCLAQARHVVVAAAHGSGALLAPHSQHVGLGETLRAVKGQLSFGPLEGEPLADHPLRDHGVFVPCYTDAGLHGHQRLWAMGSTYERGLTDTAVTEAAHQRNAASLAAMVPQAHARMQEQASDGTLQGWAGVRCASLDRLPLVGPVPAAVPLKASMQLGEVPRVEGLWTVCALGSRGLTLSQLVAEQLLAQMEGEPWPLPRSWAAALDPARFALKAARKNKQKTALPL